MRRKGFALGMVLFWALALGLADASAEEAAFARFASLWDAGKIDGSTATIPLSRAMLAHFRGVDPDGIEYEHTTTPFAYDNLLYADGDKGATLIFVTPPSAFDIREFILYNDLERDGESMEEAFSRILPEVFDVIPVVKDALVFLVNVENPVTNLTRQQLVDIYAGKITNWKEVGGNDEPIVAFQRSDRSGSQTLFEALLMDGVKPMRPPIEWLQDTMGYLVDSVAGYDNGPVSIGYSVFYYVSDMYGSDRIRLLAVDGVAPSRETIASGAYPFCTNYFAVMKKDLPDDAPERALVDWLLTDEGQRVAARAGYVPMRPLDAPETQTRAAPAARQLGTGGTASRTHEAEIEPLSEAQAEGLMRWEIAEIRLERIRAARPAFAALVDDWYREAAAAFQARHGDLPEGWETQSTRVVSATGNLFHIQLVHETSVMMATFDAVNMRRLRLSDLFYDGVPYLDRINSHIALTTVSDGASQMLSEETWNYGGMERVQMAPFRGITADYPYFRLYAGRLILYFPEKGPEIIGLHEYSDTGFQYRLNLTEDDSPWWQSGLDVD